MRGLLFVVAGALLASAPVHILPLASSPGAINPDVTQATIQKTICTSGWTATVRPAASYTNRLKLVQMARQHLTGKPSDYEEDHRVPIEIGGNPTDPANLWPQPWVPDAHDKDKLENAVKRDICAGRLTLNQGRAIFLGDWWGEWDRRYGGKK